MLKLTYNVPLVYTAESNETLIAKKVIRVLGCSTDIVEQDFCTLWNFTRCPGDSDYCNPFVLGDKIYMQYNMGIQPTPYMINIVVPQLFNIATNTEIICDPACITVEYGNDANEVKYANVTIDTTNFDNIKCFYMKVSHFKCNLNEEGFVNFFNCINETMETGKTIQQAQLICADEYCDPTIFYSEPYCKEECADTILLEGSYPNYDCGGAFYGTFVEDKFLGVTTVNTHKLQIRILGEVAPSQFDVEETTYRNNERKSAKLIRSYTLMSKQIPFYVVEQIANIFASSALIIDDVQYSKAITIPKGIEDGKMWAIRTTIQRSCDEINFSCDN